MFKFIFLLNLFTVYIPLFLIGLFMPNFTKKTLLFGIVIPEEVNSNKDVFKIQKTYKRNYAISTILIIIIINTISIRMQNVNILNLGAIALVANMTINYIYIHNKTRALKEEKGWTINKKQLVIVDTSYRYNEKYVSPHWFWIPIGITIFTVIFTIVQYPHLPEQIPINFDFKGNATGYSYKNFWSVFGLPFTQIGMSSLFYFIYFTIQRVKPSIQASRPKISSKQNQIAKRYWAIYLLVTLIIMNLQFAYIQLSILQAIDKNSIVNILLNGFATLVPVIGAIFVAAKVGQSGSRIKIDEDEELNTNVIDRDDDRFWKLGMFYYNPDDPNLFIEKRFGIGWTINFGRNSGMAIMIITLAIIIASIILPGILGHK